MKSRYFYPALLVILTLAISCSRRYMDVSNGLRKYNKGTITAAQYDSIWNSYFTINKSNFKFDNRIKLTGWYVHTDPPQAPPFNKISYNAMRFTDSSFVYYSMRIYDSISNNIVSHNLGTADRFTVEKGEIKHEYLLGRDFKIYNIFKYAKISEDGDTIRFYASETYQMSNGRREKQTVEEFIYNPTLTFIPGEDK